MAFREVKNTYDRQHLIQIFSHRATQLHPATQLATQLSYCQFFFLVVFGISLLWTVAKGELLELASQLPSMFVHWANRKIQTEWKKTVLCRVFLEKDSTPYNLLGIAEILYSIKPYYPIAARFYSVQLAIPISTQCKNTTQLVTFGKLMRKMSLSISGEQATGTSSGFLDTLAFQVVILVEYLVLSILANCLMDF